MEEVPVFCWDKRGESPAEGGLLFMFLEPKGSFFMTGRGLNKLDGMQ